MPRSESIVGRVFRIYGRMFSFNTWVEGLEVMLGAMYAFSVWVAIGAVGFYFYRMFHILSSENYFALYMLIAPFYWGFLSVLFDELVEERIRESKPAPRATELHSL
jgi:hypothetical protein